MEETQISKLKTLLKQPKKIAIIPHKSPDGDAMGSCLGVYHYLKAKLHTCSVISPSIYADFLKWLPGDDKVIRFDLEKEKAIEKIKEADLIFTLDFNTLSRSGDLAPILQQTESTFIMIDHHRQPDDYAEFTYSSIAASSTCELVYLFIEKLGETAKITPEIATCLYTGIMTDTGSFRFASTTGQTHRVTANLIDCGADNATVYQNIFDTKSTDQLKLLGVALNNLKVFQRLRTAYITLSQQELEDHNYKKGDTEGLVNYGLSLKGIIFAAIFIESKEQGIIKISLRSKGDFDVNTIARKHFNGGGHLNAAGGRSEKSLEKTVVYFEELLQEYKQKLQGE